MQVEGMSALAFLFKTQYIFVSFIVFKREDFKYIRNRTKLAKLFLGS